MSVIVDDRENIEGNPVLISGIDTFLTGWGPGKNGSVAAWACRRRDAERVFRWVKSRSDMKNVQNLTEEGLKHSYSGDWHIHIYEVGDNHPSLR